MLKALLVGLLLLTILASGCLEEVAEPAGPIEPEAPQLELEEPETGGDIVAKAVLVIAPDKFRDEELFDTRAELEKAGIETAIASIKTTEITGMLGGKVTPSLTLNDIKVEDFDAIVFIGGQGASVYFDNATALTLAKDFQAAGKVVAAICIAPSVLANAGLLEGKKATCWESEKGNLEAKGAQYTGQAVEVDGKIITGSGPTAARAFGQAIANALK